MGYKDPIKQRHFQRIWLKKRRVINRTKAIAILGGKCVDCNISDERVLQFDHLVLVLRQQRRGTDSHQIALAVIRGDLTTKDIQLRCANCHQIKTAKDRDQFEFSRKNRL